MLVREHLFGDVHKEARAVGVDGQILHLVQVFRLAVSEDQCGQRPRSRVRLRPGTDRQMYQPREQYVAKRGEVVPGVVDDGLCVAGPVERDPVLRVHFGGHGSETGA